MDSLTNAFANKPRHMSWENYFVEVYKELEAENAKQAKVIEAGKKIAESMNVVNHNYHCGIASHIPKCTCGLMGFWKALAELDPQ